MKMKRFITISAGVISSVREGEEIVAGEIESPFGDAGQLVNLITGAFTNPPALPATPSLDDMVMQSLLNTEYLVIMAGLTSL